MQHIGNIRLGSGATADTDKGSLNRFITIYLPQSNFSTYIKKNVIEQSTLCKIN